MIKRFKGIYLHTRFFALLAGPILLFVCSFIWEILFVPAQIILLLIVVFTLLDFVILFGKKQPVKASRNHTKVLSLADANKIKIDIRNKYNFNVGVKLIDELPEELQKRDFQILLSMEAFGREELTYKLEPKSRGIYTFGNINLYMSSVFRLVQRRVIVEAKEDVPVYPSIIQMKNFELKAITSISHFQGLKKIRKIGHSYEFEQIKQYVPGDDTRSINWNASGRANNIMVNQYEDERSQSVYCIIDKSRVMKMPFNQLSLLDYAINTSLVISNIVLRKHDKTGLLTFSDKLGSFIKAEKSSKQLSKILQQLYAEKVSFPESDYELLYSATRNFIHGRSLLFLFTNFESLVALERVLPILRKINKTHLLVVMFFENTEFNNYIDTPANDLMEINQQTAAKELVNQQEEVLSTLKAHGIQAIKTQAESLSLNTVNKYLELKARGYI